MADGGLGESLEGISGSEIGSETCDELDYTPACSMTEGGFGDSLGGVVEMIAEAVGVSICVTEQLPLARWSIIFGVGSGRAVFSISFMIQNSA